MLESLNSLIAWLDANPIVFVALMVWSLVWKGFGLWKSAGLRQKYWFIAILLINTLGILEMIYLFIVSKDYKVEVIENNK